MIGQGTLAGRVALVSGATRGAGLAIASVLGGEGATVYVTGRSTRAHGNHEGMAGTVEDAAAAVAARGGAGIGVRCDHADPGDVDALAARVRDEAGRLDLLVNNAWGGYERHPGGDAFTAPFWEQPADRWEAMTVGPSAALLTSRALAPLLMRGERALIATTVAWAFDAYLGQVAYDVAKAATVRLAFAMAQDLRPHRVASVAIAPGFMRTERVLAAHAASPFDLGATESPEYLGRAIAALAGARDPMRRTGDLLTAGGLAREYGFTDVDGRQPEAFRIPAG